MTYDSLKRLSSFTDIYNKTISLGYDEDSNLATLTYPDDKIVTYEYDKANRLTKVMDWLNNVTSYTYDPANNLIKTIYPEGSTIRYQYDDASRLKAIIDSKANGVLNATFKYTLDPLGNRTGISSYQALNAIPSQPDTSSTYDGDNRMLTAGSVTFNYDDNGNLITKTVGSNVTHYSWDLNDMLTQFTANGNIYTYQYDALGNRVAKIVNSVETRYMGGLAETDTSGNITAYYVYGLGLISKITPSNQSYFYHFDGIASTIGISDWSGNMVNKYAYDAFGKVLNQEESIPSPFKSVGQFGVMDEGNGLLYMRARYYDPETGRFISKDPIGFTGGLNLYGYVQNNPVNKIDPSGLIPPNLIGAGIGGTIGGVTAFLNAYNSGQRGWNLALQTAVGFGSGAISGFLLNPWSAILGGAAAGAAGNYASQRLDPCTEKVDPLKVGISAFSGAFGGMMGNTYMMFGAKEILSIAMTAISTAIVDDVLQQTYSQFLK